MVALIFGNERVTFYELNARANQLAHYLRRRRPRRNSCGGLSGAFAADDHHLAGDHEGRWCLRAVGSDLPAAAIVFHSRGRRLKSLLPASTCLPHCRLATARVVLARQ